MIVRQQSIVLSGQTPSHKNSKQLFKVGERRIVANNDRYLQWRNGAILEARSQMRRSCTGTIGLIVEFYTKDKRPRDLDNMLASVQDVLVAAHVIDDDNCFILTQVIATFAGIDKANPRAKITVMETSK